MTVPPPNPPVDSVLRRTVRWTLRGAVVVLMIVLAGRIERGLDAISLTRAAFAAGTGAAALLLVIGTRLAHRNGAIANRALDWLLLGPWTVLFVLALWWLENLLDVGPLRALLAAAAATLGSIALTLLGALWRQRKQL